jgi:hypothetical protein
MSGYLALILKRVTTNVNKLEPEECSLLGCKGVQFEKKSDVSVEQTAFVFRGRRAHHAQQEEGGM